MKVFNLIIALLFLLFAYFQWNDPDPYLWIVIYIISAGLLLYKSFKGMNQLVWTLWELFLLVFILTYLKDIFQWISDGFPSITDSMKAASPYIENIRESLGLLLIIIVFVINHLVFYRDSKIS